MKNLQAASQPKNSLFYFLLICVGLCLSTNSFATTYYSVNSGNWASTTSPYTWSTTSGGPGASATPGAGDNVVIESGYTVTVAAAASVINITVGTSNGAGTLTVNSALAASGSVTFGTTGTISGSNTLTLSTNAGITVNNAATYTATISVTTLSLGSVEPINIYTGATLAISGKISGAGGLNINPVTSNTGVLQLGGSTSSTYTGATTLNAGELAWEGSTSNQLGATSAFNIYGGTIDNISGAAVTAGNSYPLFFYGNFTWAGKNALTFLGSVTLEADISIAMGSVTAAEKSFYMCDAASTSIQGPAGNLNGFSLSLTENYSSAGAGFVCGKSTTKAPNVVNLNNLNIGTNATFTAPELAAGSPINLAGNFTNNGSFVITSVGFVNMIGTGQQTIGGSTNTQFDNLTINNSYSPSTGAVSLNGNISIVNTYTLALTQGDLSLGNYNVTMTPNSFITNSASSPYTYLITNGTGALVWTAQSSQTTYLFPVGDAATTSDYSPMNFVFSAAPSAGTMSVVAGNSKFTNNNSNTNFLDRYWTISSSGLGTYTFSSLTGTYLSGTPADINGTVGNIDNALWNGSNWTTYGAVSTSPYTVSISGATLPSGTVSGIDNSLPSITGFVQSCTALTVNVSGGETPYTYVWSPGGASTQTITPSVSNYTVTVTDANEFTTSSSVTFTALAPNPTYTNVSCGTPTGTAQVAPTGGVSPYTYSWAPGGQTTASISSLSAGTYTSTVEDNGGCIKTSVITISNIPLGLSISSVINQADCTPGSATATASSGVTPYTYTWSNGYTATSVGASTASLSGGSYTITAQDYSGCSATASVTILTSQMRDSVLTGASGSQVIDYWDFNNQTPTSSAITSIAAQYSLVSGASIAYNPNALNPTPTGGILESSNSGTGVNALNYLSAINTVLGNDSGGTSAGNLYLKALNPAADAQMTLILPTSGYNNIILNYAIEVSSSTAAPQYNTISYTTDGGVTWKTPTTAMQTTGSFTAPGVLNLWPATSWKPVQINFSSDPSVANNPNFEVTWTYSIPNTGASGNDRYDNVSLSGTLLNPDGCNAANAYDAVEYGVYPFSYSWSNGTSTVSTANPTGPILSAGTYTVTVTDANSCSTTATTTVGAAPSPIAASIFSSTNATCNLDGNATASVSGGITPYAYSWSNGTSTVSTLNPTGNVLIAGSYTLTAIDANGCSTTTSVSITQPPVVTVNIISSTNIECNTYGSATASAAGGTSPFTYTWSNSETGQTLTDLSAGTYTVTATDINGCNGTNTVAISIINQIRDSIVGANTVIHYWDFNQTLPSGGAGGDSLGTATYPLTAPYTILLSTPGYITYSRPSAIQTGATIIDGILDNGKATSPNYCYVNDLNSQPSINTVLGNDSGSAAGNLFVRSRNPDENAYMYLNLPTTGYANIVLNYAISASSTNGAQYNIFSYSTDGGNTWKNLTTAMDTFNISGVYYPDTLLAVNPTTSNSLWYPVQINFSSDPSVNNNPNFILRWTFGGANNVLASGNDRYDNISLSGNPEETCNGGSNVTLNAGAKYGVAPYTYSWSPNTNSTSTASDLSVGTYTVTISDANGCSTSTSYTVTQPALLAATVSSFTSVTCSGASTGNAFASVSGGSATYTYTWSNGTSTVSNSNPTGAVLSAGSYTVTVQDNCGASVTSSVTLTQPDALSDSAFVLSNVGCFDQNTGDAQVNATGGSQPYTYTWSNGTSTVSNSNPTGAILSGGSYTVTVQDNCGASVVASVTISQPTQFQYITAGTISNVSCNGGNNGHITTTTIGGNLPYIYSWSNGTSTVSTTQSPNTMTAGSYTVTVTDNCGVSHTATATVTQPSVMSNSVSALTNTACGGGDGGSATIVSIGGTYPYAYLWSNGASQATASNLSAGTYSVVITDLNGCTSTVSPITITQPNVLTLNLSTISYPACHGEDGSASVTAGGGTTPYVYTWSPAASTTNTATSLAAGTYTVTVKDGHRCTESLVITVTQPGAIRDTIVRAATINVSCNGGATGSATVGAKYGTAPYTYNWTPNVGSTATVSNLSTGTYSVSVTDINGCSGSTATVVITQPTLLQDSISLYANINCFGGNGGELSVGTRGGTSPYTYLWSNGNTKYTESGLTAGTYTMTITDHHGCSNTLSVTLTQPSEIMPVLTDSCIGNSMGIVKVTTSGGVAPYTYKWSNSKTTTSVTVANGTYTITVKDAHGCSETASLTVNCSAAPVVYRNPGDEPPPPPVCCQTLNDVNLYPNPNTGQFTITGLTQGMTVQVFDYTGKLISTITAADISMHLNISEQPNGIYLIRITDKDGTLVTDKKVVKTQ